MEWRRNLASSLRRLEISLPHLGKIPSTVIHAASEDEIKYARVGDFITLRDPIARVKVEKSSRPYRLIAFNRNCKEAEILVPLIIEMSFVLEEIQHPIIDSERHWKQTIEKSSRFEIGLIDWLLCLHNFAHQLPETHVMNADDRQPRDWNETEKLATLVEDTATASARMADWLLADQTVQESIDPSRQAAAQASVRRPVRYHGRTGKSIS